MSAAILAVEACTPVGLTARTTAAEIASETIRFAETEVLDRRGDPVRASRLTLMDPGETRSQRMTALASTALHGLLEQVKALRLSRAPLFLGMPEPGGGGAVDEEGIAGALRRLGSRLQVKLEVSAKAEGRASFFAALAAATREIEARRTDVALVGGVDSLCDPETLEHLSRAGRTLGQSRDGIIPGEGAALLLLGDGAVERAAADAGAAAVRGAMLACALAREPASFQSGQPCLGDGLSEAFRALRRDPDAGGRRAAAVFSGQTGETFWAHERARAYLRNVALMPEPYLEYLVAENLGDVGAAAGAIQAAYALHRLHPGRLERPRALVYACSDSGHVGACVLEAR